MLNPTVYSSFSHLNGNLLCAVDVETTGCMPGYHEIIQIAIVPLDSNIEPIDAISPFYITIAPQYPERLEKEAASKHKLDVDVLIRDSLDSERVSDLFHEWFQKLNLPYRKSLVPLAHNWPFEAGFLKAWLGLTGFNSYWHPHPRDTMQIALTANDRAYMRGDKIPFNRVNLSFLCHHFNIKLENAHDALHDALATAKVFQNLLRVSLF